MLPFQGVLDGMTLMEFRSAEKEDVDAFFAEASVPFSKRTKFRMLHKGL